MLMTKNNHNSKLENTLNLEISRREALAILGGISATLLIPGYAKAARYCSDETDWYNNVTRTCTTIANPTMIFARDQQSDVLSITQKQSMWCGAACLETIFSY